MRTNNVFLWLCATVAGAVLFSCTPKETEIEGSVSRIGKTVFATLEQPSEADTKVYLDSDYKVCWHSGDVIAVADGRNVFDTYAFQGQTGDTSGDFQCTDSPSSSSVTIDGCLAVYPNSCAIEVSADKSVLAYCNPLQIWVEKSFGQEANLMLSSSASLEDGFHFKNVMGILVVKLYGTNVRVNSVALTVNGDHLISGYGYMQMSSAGEPQMQLQTANGSNTITMESSSPIRLGASEDAATEFWFALLPGVYESGISITVSGPSGTFTKSTSNSIEVVRSKIRRMAPLEMVPELNYDEPDAIDLGLPSGTLWASRNLGAATADQFGGYYAFAETETKSRYDWTTWKYFNGSYLTKYNNHPDDGPVDHRLVLDPSDDAATVHLGSQWRIPTLEEVLELLNNCSFNSYNSNGVSAVRLTGPNNNSIVLPLAGLISSGTASYIGQYAIIRTGNVLLPTSSNDNGAAVHYVINTKTYAFYYPSYAAGASIRPVKSAFVPVSSVSIDSSPATLSLGETTTLQATVQPSNATYPTVYWESSNTSVATVDQDGIVTTVNEGTAVITARSADAQFSDTCTITVENNYAAATGVSISVDGTLPDAFYTGMSVQLKATVTPADARQDVVWTSSNESILWVDENGLVTAVGAGQAGITATPVAECPFYTTKFFTVVQRYPNAVDLGLTSGLKWADRNLCADTPAGFGSYYCWGETATKSKTAFDYGHYKWYDEETDLLTFSYDASSDYATLEAADDAATTILGSSWRMPTFGELSELKKECTWEAVSEYDGISVDGYKATGPNGNSIFFPSAGTYFYSYYPNGFYYWSSTLYTNAGQAVVFRYTGFGANPVSYGCPIRPVYVE